MTVYVSAYGRCPPIVIWVECKSGPRSEPDVCTEEGGTRVSAYVARLSNKNAPQAGTSFQDESLESTISAVRKAMAMMVI